MNILDQFGVHLVIYLPDPIQSIVSRQPVTHLVVYVGIVLPSAVEENYVMNEILDCRRRE